MSSDFDIPKTFESAFSEPSQLAKIPYLDSLSTTSLKSGTVVRFLGMVQDTSYSQEIYIGMTRSQNVVSPSIPVNCRNGSSIDI
jgi:hypothetical protein